LQEAYSVGLVLNVVASADGGLRSAWAWVGWS
jgi:hypothetical protein